MESDRIVKGYFVVLVGSILGYTVLYSVGMATFEGKERSLLRSLQVVMQSFTTIGYGGESPWESTPMLVLIVTMQLTTLLLIFGAFPAVIVPILKESLSEEPPASRGDLSDHVVVCGATSHTESLIDELVDREVPYVIVEPDRERATDLYGRDREVVHGDPESMAVLEGVNVTEARALVADNDDEVDLSVITSATELAPDLPAYSIATDEEFVEYHELAGAERAFLPRTLLGHGIANKVRNTVSSEIESDATVGRDFEIAEIPVAEGSDLDGRRLAAVGIEDRTARHVIGVWSRGRFHTPPFEGVRLDAHAILLVVGREVAVRSIAKSAGSSANVYGRGRVLVAGSGVVGQLVSDTLIRDGIPQTLIDIADHPRVDVVGDVTEEETLEEAGIDEARTVVLALDDDTTTLVASFVLRTIAPDVEVVARANEAESVPKLYRAGADYVLALSTVAGRLLATAILDSDEPVALDEQLRLVDRDPGGFAGGRLGDAAVRERTDCAVVAVEHRDGRVSSDLREWTEIAETDRLVIAGTDRAIDRFDELA